MVNKRKSLLGRAMLLSMLLFSILASVGWAADDNTQPSASFSNLVYVVPVEQTIESGLQSFLERAFEEAEEAHAAYVILQINTLGGRVDAAMAIGERIRNSPVPTVAFIHGKAISAGSYISLNADKIVMAKGSTIGAAAMVDQAGNRITDSKTVSAWVAEMTAAANMNDRNPMYAAGMVDDTLMVEVPEIGKTYGKGQLLSFDYKEALSAGYAEANADTLEAVLQYLGMEEANVIEIEPTIAETLARFLTHPVVMTLLLLIGLGGVLIELFAPGFGLPGILGVVSLILYFSGNFIAGFAGIEHIVLFVAGLVLLVLEIFVPSFGILGISGLICLSSGIVLAAFDHEQALISLAIAFFGSLIAVVIVGRFVGLRGVWKKLVLKEELKTEAGFVSNSPKQHLLGKTGTSLTVLRPSGTALIDGQRIDVVTSGQFIPANTEIEVVFIEGTRVVVKELNKQP